MSGPKKDREREKKLFSGIENQKKTACPTINGGVQNGTPVGTCTSRTHIFARLAPTCNAPSVLLDKFFASELGQKFIKSAHVGWLGGRKREEDGQHSSSLKQIFYLF